jgi:hypothetical protein
MHGGRVLGVCVGSNSANSSLSESDVKIFNPGFRASHRSALEPSWSRHADVLLEPQVRHIDWNDFSRVDEAFSAGAEAMRRELPLLRELLERQSQSGPAPDMALRAERGLAL